MLKLHWMQTLLSSVFTARCGYLGSRSIPVWNTAGYISRFSCAQLHAEACSTNMQRDLAGRELIDVGIRIFQALSHRFSGPGGTEFQ
jgi:hypothetical protein